MLLEVLGIPCRLHEYKLSINYFMVGTCGGFLISVIRHVCLCFEYQFEIFLMYNYATFPFDVCTY